VGNTEVRIGITLGPRPVTVPIPEEWQEHATAQAFSKGEELAVRPVRAGERLLAVEVYPAEPFRGSFWKEAREVVEHGKGSQKSLWKFADVPKARSLAFVYLGSELESKPPKVALPLTFSHSVITAFGRPLDGAAYLEYTANEAAPRIYDAWPDLHHGRENDFRRYIAARRVKTYVHYRMEGILAVEGRELIEFRVSDGTKPSGWYLFIGHTPVGSWLGAESARVTLAPGLHRVTLAVLGHQSESIPVVGVSRGGRPSASLNRVLYAGEVPLRLTVQERGKGAVGVRIGLEPGSLFASVGASLQVAEVHPVGKCGDDQWTVGGQEVTPQVPVIMRVSPQLDLGYRSECVSGGLSWRLPLPLPACERTRLSLVVEDIPHILLADEGLEVRYRLEVAERVSEVLSSACEIAVHFDDVLATRENIPESPFARALTLWPPATSRTIRLTPEIAGAVVGESVVIDLVPATRDSLELVQRGTRLGTKRGYAVLAPYLADIQRGMRPARHRNLAVVSDFLAWKGPGEQRLIRGGAVRGAAATEKFVHLSELLNGDEVFDALVWAVGRKEYLCGYDLRTLAAELRFFIAVCQAYHVTPVLATLPGWEGQDPEFARALALMQKELGYAANALVIDGYSAALLARMDSRPSAAHDTYPERLNAWISELVSEQLGL